MGEMEMSKIIVNKNYLKLLEEGVPMEHIKMYTNATSGLLDVSKLKEEADMLMKGAGVGFNIPYAETECIGDERYNEPKSKPKADPEDVEETILSTEIYRRARFAILHDEMLSQETKKIILKVQDKQVAYGIDKYPEPLNPNTWTMSETVDHIMDESIDKLHYLVMLRIKLEQAFASSASHDTKTVRNLSSRIARINEMAANTIEDMGYLIRMNELMEKETESRFGDSIDTSAYAMQIHPDYGSVQPCNLMAGESPVYSMDSNGKFIKLNNLMDSSNPFINQLKVYTSKEIRNIQEKGYWDGGN